MLLPSQLTTHNLSYTVNFATRFLHTYPPMKMEETERSEMLAYKIQKPGNYPEESVQQESENLDNCN